MTPRKLPHAQRFNIQKDESTRERGGTNKEGRETYRGEREGGEVKKNSRGQERERYRKNREKGKLQLLNDHPVHSYLSRIGFPFSSAFQFRFTSSFLPKSFT